MWMRELVMKTRTADRSTGSQSEPRLTMGPPRDGSVEGTAIN
jgi:hypothetical protein